MAHRSGAGWENQTERRSGSDSECPKELHLGSDWACSKAKHSGYHSDLHWDWSWAEKKAHCWAKHSESQKA